MWNIIGRKSTMKKILIVLLIIVIILSVFACKNSNSDEDKYNKAIELYLAGDYHKAFTMFEEVGDYKNAEQFIEDIAASLKLAEISDFPDSTEPITTTTAKPTPRLITTTTTTAAPTATPTPSISVTVSPDLPVEVSHGYESSMFTKMKITNLSYAYTYSLFQKQLWIYTSGEKTWDESGDSGKSAIGYEYQLLDSEGYVVDSGNFFMMGLRVGNKFKDDDSIRINIQNFKSGDYTFKILD